MVVHRRRGQFVIRIRDFARPDPGQRNAFYAGIIAHGRDDARHVFAIAEFTLENLGRFAWDETFVAVFERDVFDVVFHPIENRFHFVWIIRFS